MRRFAFSLIVASCLLSAGPLVAGGFDENLPHISWKDAANHYGERCVVYGTVVAAKDIGSRCFLNFDKNVRDTFTLMIPREHYDKFPDAPDKLYREEHLRAVGTVVEFHGKPEIVIESPDQIEILDDPTPPAGGRPAETAQDRSSGEGEGDETATPEPSAAPPPPTTAPARTPRPDGVVRVATFNVLNLFDDHDDPYVENERLPGKDKEEIRLLADTVRKLDADIVALQEVENRPFLEQFVRDHLADMGYREIVLFEGNSDRGIDVGLLSRIDLGSVTSHRHFDFVDAKGQQMRFQRDLLQVRVRPKGHQAFDVFVVHLKSKYGGEEVSLPIRMGEATVIRDVFDDMLQRDPQALFIICGDFNDTFESTPVRHLIGQGDKALRTFVDELPSEKRVTLPRWDSMIDFIFASPAMGKLYRPGSYDVIRGTVETSGSDHNPVVAEFKLPAGGRP